MRNKIFALQHINDIALISKEFEPQELKATSYPPRLAETTARRREAGKLQATRVEAYDISNIFRHECGWFDGGFYKWPAGQSAI